MRRQSDRHVADLHNGHKLQHRYSIASHNISMLHWLIKAKKRGKEDSAVGCHFGRREFGLRGALREHLCEANCFSTCLPIRLLRSYSTCT
eukprot:scaffold64995_cov41-Attheya_sp.AAC.3